MGEIMAMTAARTAEHLQQTSRTFALAIPLLPEPCRREVGLAYLLFRVADTLEDAAHWSVGNRIEALGELTAALTTGDRAQQQVLSNRWFDAKPSDNPSYVALLAELPSLLAAIDALEPEPRRILRAHAQRTAEGMAEIQRNHWVGHRLELKTMAELQRYCYVVAGIVGELLTELFVVHAPSLARVAGELHRDHVAFGEALQLVNILKDQGVDEREGRLFLPASIPAADVVAQARADLLQARRYVGTLREGRALPGMVAFTQLPLELAWASLEEVERHGPGAKVARSRVRELFDKAKALVHEAAPGSTR
jgi:farnesyl-diphosphate farnesyltransferase